MNDGGPVQGYMNLSAKIGSEGLSKLEWFAGLAMHAIFVRTDAGTERPLTLKHAEAACIAFDVAAAMLAEVEKRQAPTTETTSETL